MIQLTPTLTKEQYHFVDVYHVFLLHVNLEGYKSEFPTYEIE